MIIRPYTEKDFEGVKEVIQSVQTTDCWPVYYPNGWGDERIKKEFSPTENCRDPLFLISEERDKVTGLIAGHDLASFVNGKIPHLRKVLEENNIEISETFYQKDLIVHKNHQNRFSGFRLFRKLETYAQEKEYKLLVTRTPPLNTIGIDFFLGIGYKRMFMDTTPHRVYFMKRLIGSKSSN